MDIDFLEFIEKTNKANKPEDIFVLFENACKKLGYDRFVYSQLTNHLSMGKHRQTDGQKRCGFCNYPGGWLQGDVGPDTDKKRRSMLLAIAQQFHLAYCELQKDNAPLKSLLPSLTNREREVLNLCATGKANEDIAKILSISGHGVEFHMRNVFKKLEVNSRLSAVVIGIRLGFVDHI